VVIKHRIGTQPAVPILLDHGMKRNAAIWWDIEKVLLVFVSRVQCRLRFWVVDRKICEPLTYKQDICPAFSSK
jgi:hypothetical protein